MPPTGTNALGNIGFYITDEIFGISIAQEGCIHPFYPYGAMAVAIPGWSVGTMLGIIAGNLLPARAVNALGVTLYGMFLAIIIPPARKSKILAGLIAASFALSFLFTVLPFVSALPEGTRTIILTVGLSSLAAILFPRRPETEQGADTA